MSARSKRSEVRKGSQLIEPVNNGRKDSEAVSFARKGSRSIEPASDARQRRRKSTRFAMQPADINECLQLLEKTTDPKEIAEICVEYERLCRDEENEPHQARKLIEVLILANTKQSIQLADGIVSGEVGNIAWGDNRGELGEVLLQMSTLTLTTEDIELLEVYNKLIGSLSDRAMQPSVAGDFWSSLFEAPSFYYAYAVGALDQIGYVEKLTPQERQQFLQKLCRLLAKSNEAIFQNDSCTRCMNTALSDAVDMALSDVVDGEGFASEVNRLVQTCLNVSLKFAKGSSQLTVHGCVLLAVLRSMQTVKNLEYKRVFFQKNLHEIIKWSLADLPERCPDSWTECKCTAGEFAKTSREIILDLAKVAPDIVEAVASELIAAYDKHPDAMTLKALSTIYPGSKCAPAIEAHFELFYRKIENIKDYLLDGLFELLFKFAEHSSELYTARHVNELMSRTGYNEADMPEILAIVASIAKHNTPVMIGRGENYYKLIQAATQLKENAATIDRIFGWLALFSEEEADRVLEIMREAYSDSSMEAPVMVNHMLQEWQNIAQVYKAPVNAHRPWIEKWLENEETSEEAQLLIDILQEDGSLAAVKTKCCVLM